MAGLPTGDGSDWPRSAGTAGIVGAALWTVAPWLETATLGTRPYAATPLDPVALVGLLLMGAALAALHATLGDAYGLSGRTGAATAGLGLSLVAALQARATVLSAAAGLRPVPATGEDPLLLVAAYAGYGLLLVGTGLLGAALWRLPDRPTWTALLLAAAALAPVPVLPLPVRMRLVRANALFAPLGIAWVALGRLVRVRAP